VRAVFTEAQSSRSAHVPCCALHLLALLLLRLALGKLVWLGRKSRGCCWIHKPWCELIVSLWVNYCLAELWFPLPSNCSVELGIRSGHTEGFHHLLQDHSPKGTLRIVCVAFAICGTNTKGLGHAWRGTM
jgi:hypothetical protein